MVGVVLVVLFIGFLGLCVTLAYRKEQREKREKWLTEGRVRTAQLEVEAGLALAPPRSDVARCPKCAFPLIAGALFCDACGASCEQRLSAPRAQVALVCHDCAALNAPNALFCCACGKSLSYYGPRGPLEAQPTSASAPQQEVRSDLDHLYDATLQTQGGAPRAGWPLVTKRRPLDPTHVFEPGQPASGVYKPTGASVDLTIHTPPQHPSVVTQSSQPGFWDNYEGAPRRKKRRPAKGEDTIEERGYH